MKTTRTTTKPTLKSTTADHSEDQEKAQRDRVPGTNLKPPVAYPDLEDFIPENYLTTQDLPKYGKGRPAEET